MFFESSEVVKVASRKSGFTLVEMLVVISILGLLAALAVPALKNLGKSNITVSASRQLLDDVGRARQLAMANRTTVYMVFVPTNFWGNTTWFNALNQTDQEAVTNLLDKQLTGYTFISYGAVSDQPGQHQWHYLESWRTLPDGMFIAAQTFAGTNQVASYAVSEFNYTNTIPFPTEDSISGLFLPYIAFNYLGQLTDDGINMAAAPEYIPLARGAVQPAIDPSSKTLQLGTATISESPPGNSTSSAYNLIQIDPLTGRATLLNQKVQ